MIATRKDEVLIAALLTCPTIKEAAKKAGLSESRMHDRLNDEGFQQKYSEARRQLLEQATASLQASLNEAIEKIKSVMNDPKSKPQIVLNAADMLLRNCYKMTETTDILVRLSKLEEAAHDGT